MTDARRTRPGRRLSRRPRRARVRPAGRAVQRRVPRRPRRRTRAAAPKPARLAPLPLALPPTPEVPLLPPPAPTPAALAAPPEAELSGPDRFIAWAFLFGGFAGFALLVAAAWALEAEVPPADTWMRQGLAAGTAAALLLQTLAVAGGVGRLADRPWGRLTLRLASLLGVILAVAAFTTLASGPLEEGALLVPSDVALMGLVADAILAVFFGWALVRLAPQKHGPSVDAAPAWTPPAT